MQPLSVLLAFAAIATTMAIDTASASDTFKAPLNPDVTKFPSGKRLVAYYANWGTYKNPNYPGHPDNNGPPYENYQPADLPIKLLTDVNYAFYTIANKTADTMSEVPASNDNFSDFEQQFSSKNVDNPSIHSVSPPDAPGQAYYGNFGQFMKLRKAGNKFNFGLAIGGWTGSKYFSSAMRTPELFVDGIMDVLKQYPGLFNRVDIDWEYVQDTSEDNYGNGNEASPDDPANFAKFLEILRKRLDAAGLTKFEITGCVTPNPARMTALPFPAMIKYLDYFNVMTYDFKSSAWGDEISGPHSNVYTVEPYAHFSVDLAVKAYLGYGVPASKINIGVAMYSQVFGNTTGINQPTNGPGSDSYNTQCPSGNCDYSQIPLAGSTEYWDSASKSSYTYNPTTMDLLAYDSVYAVYEKCQYVWDHGLAGIIAWEASNDVRDSKNRRSLFAAMNRCLSKDPRRNHGTKCNTNIDSKGCAATAVATCKNNVWVVKDCPNGQVCVGTDWNTRCQTPANPEIWN